MRWIAILPLALAACMEATPEQHAMVPGHQLLVFFDSGYDEPPTGGILNRCDTAPSGLCVRQGNVTNYPLTRTATGWRYEDSAARITLENDGTGHLEALSSDYTIGVTWMTEPWE